MWSEKKENVYSNFARRYMFVGSIVCLSDRIWYFPDKFEAFSGHPICFYIYEWGDGGRNISI